MKVIKPGDDLSFGLPVWSATGAGSGRLVIEWLDVNGAVISTINGTTVAAPLPAPPEKPQQSIAQNIAVPANADDVNFYREIIDASEEVFFGDLMANYGPVVQDYSDPELQPDIQDASALKYSSGEAVDSLKPAEAGAQQTSGKSLTVLTDTNTSNLSDDAGLGSSAAWGGIDGVPDTILGHNLEGVVQPSLPSATADEQVLVLDADGSVHVDDRWPFGGPFRGGVIPGMDAPLATSSAQIGSAIRITAPGRACIVYAQANLSIYGSDAARVRVEISDDGGATWYTGNYAYLASGGDNMMTISEATLTDGSGDILVRLTGYAGTQNAVSVRTTDVFGGVWVSLLPPTVLSASLDNAPLAASIANQSGSATATYPSTQPTCTTAFPVTASGGVGAKHYSAAITSQPAGGVATLINASTSNPQVQLTGATATEAGTTYTTGVSETVTDSATPTPASVTSTATISQTLYLVYAPITGSIRSQGGGCARFSGNACTATGSATENLNGGNDNYNYGWAITGQTLGGATLTGASLKTCSVSGTATVGQTNKVSVRCNANDSRNTGQITTSGSVTLTYHDNGPQPT